MIKEIVYYYDAVLMSPLCVRPVIFKSPCGDYRAGDLVKLPYGIRVRILRSSEMRDPEAHKVYISTF